MRGLVTALALVEVGAGADQRFDGLVTAAGFEEVGHGEAPAALPARTYAHGRIRLDGGPDRDGWCQAQEPVVRGSPRPCRLRGPAPPWLFEGRPGSIVDRALDVDVRLRLVLQLALVATAGEVADEVTLRCREDGCYGLR